MSFPAASPLLLPQPLVLVEDEPPIHIEQVRQPPVLRIRASSGRFFEIEMTPAQKQTHEQLHSELLALALGQDVMAPGTSINVTEGTIERNGQTIFFGELHHPAPSREWSEKLTQLRQLYHAALGQKFSDVLWYSYTPGDRAHSNAPLPFQSRKDPALANLAVDFEALREDYPELNEDQLQLIENRRVVSFNNIIPAISNYFEQRLSQLQASRDLNAQSRMRQIAKAQNELRNLDQFVIDYAAIFLGTFPEEGTVEEKRHFLNEQKKEAIKYLNKYTEPSFGTRMKERIGLGSAQQRARAVDQLATELPLLSCTTAPAYAFGCRHFEIEPSKTSIELSVIWLAERIITRFYDAAAEEDRDAAQERAVNLIDSDIEYCLQTAFADSISSPEERELLIEAVKNAIVPLEEDAGSESDASSEYYTPGSLSPIPSPPLSPREYERENELP